MREIKFRGKRIDNGKWVYGSLVRELTTAGIVPFIESAVMVERFRVLSESVGQFIGFRDNPPGKVKRTEMYEEDVVRLYTFFNEEEPELNDSTIHKIEYRLDDDFPGFDLVPYGDWECNGISWALCDTECVGIMVIGNVIENPELLDKRS